MIQALRPMIFFDIDETLVDQRAAEAKAAAVFWQIYGDQLPQCSGPDDLARLWRLLREKQAPSFLHGQASSAEQRRRRMRELFAPAGRRLSDAEADRIFGQFLEVYRSSWRLFSDVEPALGALHARGCRLGIISNGDAHQQRQKLALAGISDYFEVVVISGDIRIPKPHPAIFRAACARAGLSPCECTHIGDRLDCDAHAATTAGLGAFWLDRRGSAVPAKVPRLTDLAQLQAAPQLRLQVHASSVSLSAGNGQ